MTALQALPNLVEALGSEKGRFGGSKTASGSGLIWPHEEQAVVFDNCDPYAVRPTRSGPRKFPLNAESWAPAWTRVELAKRRPDNFQDETGQRVRALTVGAMLLQSGWGSV